LDHVAFETLPVFHLAIPTACEGVPTELLNPRNTWEDPAMYDQTALSLAQKFQNNFRKFEAETASVIVEAGPKS
jgi:phosphoenolpyruvate carboxykinase (ATP)